MFSLLADVPLTGAVVLEWFIYIYYIIIYLLFKGIYSFRAVSFLKYMQS